MAKSQIDPLFGETPVKSVSQPVIRPSLKTGQSFKDRVRFLISGSLVLLVIAGVSYGAARFSVNGDTLSSGSCNLKRGLTVSIIVDSSRGMFALDPSHNNTSRFDRTKSALQELLDRFAVYNLSVTNQPDKQIRVALVSDFAFASGLVNNSNSDIASVKNFLTSMDQPEKRLPLPDSINFNGRYLGLRNLGGGIGYAHTKQLLPYTDSTEKSRDQLLILIASGEANASNKFTDDPNKTNDDYQSLTGKITEVDLDGDGQVEQLADVLDGVTVKYADGVDPKTADTFLANQIKLLKSDSALSQPVQLWSVLFGDISGSSTDSLLRQKENSDLIFENSTEREDIAGPIQAIGNRICGSAESTVVHPIHDSSVLPSPDVSDNPLAVSLTAQTELVSTGDFVELNYQHSPSYKTVQLFANDHPVEADLTAPQGSVRVGPITDQTTYRLIMTKDSGESVDSMVTVSVSSPSSLVLPSARPQVSATAASQDLTLPVIPAGPPRTGESLSNMSFWEWLKTMTK